MPTSCKLSSQKKICTDNNNSLHHKWCIAKLSSGCYIGLQKPMISADSPDSNEFADSTIHSTCVVYGPHTLWHAYSYTTMSFLMHICVLPLISMAAVVQVTIFVLTIMYQ